MAFPVLLMNPRKGTTMAARKTTPAKKTPVRRRRRRNPSYDIKGAGVAAAGGLLAGAGAYALDGADMKGSTKAGIMIAVSLLAGVAATSMSKGAGFGLIGGGIAIGSKALADQYLAKSEDMSAVYRRQLPEGENYPQMEAVMSYDEQTRQWQQAVPTY